MESIVRNVKDIELSERRVYENVLGQELADNQHVFIMVMTPNAVPDEAQRRRAFADIERLSEKAADHARRQGATEQEIDDVIDEAVEHARRQP